MAIEHISDTARWVAVYRALETERPDAVFRDPFARRLAGPRGEEISRGMGRRRASASSVIVRTAVFDEIILRSISAGDVELVVNLAAGLDARPWRLPLPPSLRWVDVDLPEILDYKRDVMKTAEPGCHYDAIGADLTDATNRARLLARLREEVSDALIVTEGLLIYLSADQVATLARELAATAAFRRWLLDLASPELLRIMDREWGPRLALGEARFQFAPTEGTNFFTPFGWKEVESRTLWDEGHRLRREMRFMWLWRFLSRFAPPERREAFRALWRFVLLERGD